MGRLEKTVDCDPAGMVSGIDGTLNFGTFSGIIPAFIILASGAGDSLGVLLPLELKMSASRGVLLLSIEDDAELSEAIDFTESTFLILIPTSAIIAAGTSVPVLVTMDAKKSSAGARQFLAS